MVVTPPEQHQAEDGEAHQAAKPQHCGRLQGREALLDLPAAPLGHLRHQQRPGVDGKTPEQGGGSQNPDRPAEQAFQER